LGEGSPLLFYKSALSIIVEAPPEAAPHPGPHPETEKDGT
jgi:hypothetical protein